MRRLAVALFVVLALVTVVPVAQADVIYANASSSLGASIDWIFDGSWDTGWAGRFNVTRVSGSEALGSSFTAYCVDLARSLDSSNEPYEIKNLSAIPDTDPYGWSDPNQYTDPSWALQTGRKVAWLLNTYEGAGLVTTNTQAAALQAAIWETLFGNKFYLRSTTADAIETQMKAYLDAIPADTSNSQAYWLDSDPYASDSQDLGVPMANPVPEPGSMLLLGSGLIGLAGAVRRRMKK